MDDEYEDRRIKELKRVRKAVERDDGMTLEEMDGPGSFGCHEVLHVSDLIARLIEDQLITHPAILLNPRWHYLACEAQDHLARLYQEIGSEHGKAQLPGSCRPAASAS